jgi:hypothetical protein
VPGPDDIVAMSDMLDQIQRSEAEEASNTEAIDNIGKNVVDSSIYGVGNKPPKVKAQLLGPEKQRLRNKMDIIVESWFRLKKKYVKDTKAKTVVAKTQKDGAKGSMLSKEAGEKEGGGLLDWISGLMGILGLGKFGAGGLVRLLGRWLWKGIKFAGKAMWGALKGVGKAAWSAIKAGFRGVGSFFGGLWKGFTGSRFWKGFTSTIGKGISAAKGALGKAGSFLKNSLKSVADAAKGALGAVTGGGGGAAAKPKAPKPPKKVPWYKRAWSAVKSGAKKVGSVVKAGAGMVVKGAKAVGGAVKKGAKAVGGFVSKFAIKPAKAMVGAMLKKVVGGGKGIVKFLGGTARKLPIIGPVISALFTGAEILGVKKRFAAGELTRDEAEMEVGNVAIKGITQAVGSGLGAFLGGLVSLGTGPFAPLVAWIPMILGSLVGGALGKFVGGLLTKYILPKSATKTIGRFFGGFGKKEGDKPMQDFIWRSGEKMPIPFTSKDDLLGMKKGGAISQLFNRLKDKSKDKPGSSTPTGKPEREPSWFSRVLKGTAAVTSKLLGTSKDTTSKVVSGISKAAGSLFDRAKDMAVKYAALPASVKDKILSASKDSTTKVLDVQKKVQTGIFSGIKKTASSLFDRAKNMVGKFLDGSKETRDKILNVSKDNITKALGSKLVTGAKGVIGKFLDRTTETRDKILNISKDNITKVLDRSTGLVSRLVKSSKDSIDKLIRIQRTSKLSSKPPVTAVKPDAFAGIRGVQEGGSDRLAKLQLNAIDLSNKYLYQIVQLTQALVKKSGGGNAGGSLVSITKPSNSIPPTQGNPDGPSFPDSRVEFYNSPYSMHTPGTLT